MLLKVHPDNPAPRHLKIIKDILDDSGVIIYPTDSVYSFGCSLGNTKAFEQICRIKGIKPEKANFSIVCNDLSNISEYAQVDNATFKLLKKALPGPFTFILKASRNVPKIFQTNKKTIGIRIPDNLIARELVTTTGKPIIATSVHDEDSILEYTTDPGLIHERYEKVVNLVVDGGIGSNIASTIVDCSEGEPVVLRQGAGEFELIR